MLRTPSVRYVVVLTLCTYFSSAQILFSNQDAYVVSETTIYEIVKKVLLSNFASIDEKIRGTLSVQNQQISSGSDANILKLNERVSSLEDEIQTLKDNMSSKRNSEIELLERKTQNCSRQLENLESRFQETKLLMEDSNILTSKQLASVSEFLNNFTSALDNLDVKIDLMQNSNQNLSQGMTNVESRMNKSLHETGLQINMSYSKMNDKIKNMSVTMEMMEIAINESEAKLECMRKDQQKLDESMQNIELRVSTEFKNTNSQLNLSNSLTNEKLINMSAIMRISHTSLKIEDISKNVSVSELKIQQGVNASLQEIRREFSNYTGHIQRTLKEALNKSVWMTEKRQQSLTAKLSSALINVTKMLDNTKERLHQEDLKINATMHKLEDNITKLTEKVIKSNLEMSSLKQNMSKRIDDTFIHLNHSFIVETIHLKDNIETVGEKCENMTKTLEIIVDEKVISSVDNLTKSLNQTNIQMELQGSKMFRSIGILDEQVQTLQTEKSNLLKNVAKTRNELSELKRNETMGTIYLNSRITELALNISSLANETQMDHKHLVARFSANVSGIDNRLKNISQNVSLLFDNLMLQMDLQQKFNGTLKDIQVMFQVYKRDNELRISGTLQNCLEMNRQLEQSVHEEIILSVINMTKNINMTNNRMHLQELKMNQSIGLIETKLKKMQSEKLILEANVSDVKRVISDVKRNNTFSFNKVHFQIMEIGSNVSSVKSKIQTKLDDFTAKVNANVSETNIRVKDIVQNVSFLLHHSMSIEQTIAETVQKCVEMNKLLETTVDAKVVSSSVNLTKSINHTNNRTESQIFLLNHSIGLLNEQLKQLQTEKSNLVGSIAETKNKLSSVASELQTKQSHLELDIASNISRINDNYISLLNLSEQTNIITLHIQDLTQNLSSVEKELDVQLNLCKTNFDQHFRNQTENFEHKLLEFNRTIEVKWSFFNETLFRKTRIVENDITSKNGHLSSRLDQFSGNINNMMQKLNTLECSNIGQNNRLSSIESRLSTVSSTLESSNSGQNNRLSSIESSLSTVSSTLRNLRSDFNSHIPRK